MKKYIINGQELYPANQVLPDNDSFELRTKFNNLLEALGEPVENTGQCNECFDGFHENCINLITVCACKSCTKIEEKPKWDKNNLKEGNEYWYVDSYGKIACSRGDNPDAINWRLATNNVFETEEEAGNYKRKILGK